MLSMQVNIDSEKIIILEESDALLNQPKALTLDVAPNSVEITLSDPNFAYKSVFFPDARNDMSLTFNCG